MRLTAFYNEWWCPMRKRHIQILAVASVLILPLVTLMSPPAGASVNSSVSSAPSANITASGAAAPPTVSDCLYRDIQWLGPCI